MPHRFTVNTKYVRKQRYVDMHVFMNVSLCNQIVFTVIILNIMRSTPTSKNWNESVNDSALSITF